MEGETWDERFAYAPNATLSYASGDEQPAELAGSQQVLQLGVLCNSDESASLREECDHILHVSPLRFEPWSIRLPPIDRSSRPCGDRPSR